MRRSLSRLQSCPMRRERNFRRAVATAFCVGGALLIFASAPAFSARAGGEPPLPPVRPPSSPSEARPGGGTPSQPPVAPKTPQPTEAAACLAELRANEVDAEIVPAPPAPVADCGVAEPIRLTSIGLSDTARVDLPGRPTVDCAFALTFTGFVWRRRCSIRV